MSDVAVGTGPKRGRGRPAGGTRDPSRAPTRESTRAATHEETRDGTRERVFYGRDGEVLRRTQHSLGDPYLVPEELKEPGWSYQWITQSVTGNTEIVAQQNSMFYANSWRPVPADRQGFRERFGQTGPRIVIGGMMLVERPEGLTEEARQADYQAAIGQVRDRDSALMGGKAALKQALDRVGYPVDQSPVHGRRTRVSLEAEGDSPLPSHPIAYGEDLTGP
jgi:hypothetical protein